MASAIEQLVDSVFFQRLVAERGLTDAQQIADFASQVMARGDLDIQGAFDRGDVTATMQPSDFLRAVQRPVEGEGPAPSVGEPKPSFDRNAPPDPGATGVPGRDGQLTGPPDPTMTGQASAISDWARAFNEDVRTGDYTNSDRLMQIIRDGGDHQAIDAPTVAGLSQKAQKYAAPGEGLAIDDIPDKVMRELTSFLAGIDNPGSRSQNTITSSLVNAAVPGAGVVTGMGFDAFNLKATNERRARAGLEPFDFPFFESLFRSIGRSIPVFGAFVDPAVKAPYDQWYDAGGPKMAPAPRKPAPPPVPDFTYASGVNVGSKAYQDWARAKSNARAAGGFDDFSGDLGTPDFSGYTGTSYGIGGTGTNT